MWKHVILASVFASATCTPCEHGTACAVDEAADESSLLATRKLGSPKHVECPGSPGTMCAGDQCCPATDKGGTGVPANSTFPCPTAEVGWDDCETQYLKKDSQPCGHEKQRCCRPGSLREGTTTIGADGCDSSQHLDCVDGTCAKCGAHLTKCCAAKSKFGLSNEGCLDFFCANGICQECGSRDQACCDYAAIFGSSDGCDTTNNYDCVSGTCMHCGQKGEKCCDDTSRHGVGSDGCITNVYCKNHTCH